MHPKKFVVMIVITSVSILCLTTFLIVNGSKDEPIKDSEYNKLKYFDASDYEDSIAAFSVHDVYLGNTSDTDLIVKEAEEIWKGFFDDIVEERPYQVFYNQEKKLLLITGTMKPDYLGGVANMIVEKNTKRVLAIWHEK